MHLRTAMTSCHSYEWISVWTKNFRLKELLGALSWTMFTNFLLLTTRIHTHVQLKLPQDTTFSRVHVCVSYPDISFKTQKGHYEINFILLYRGWQTHGG